jgi:hypothetical protein
MDEPDVCADRPMSVNRPSQSILTQAFEGRTPMNIPSTNWAFDAEDRKVYWAWLRGTLAVYGAIALCGMVAAAFLATANIPNVEAFLTTAVALASP